MRKAFDTIFARDGELVITRNPWRILGRQCGISRRLRGSCTAKGGNAAGSVRVPAAFTGLVGLKPARGLLPPQRGTNELATTESRKGC